ncbi:MAG: MBL fold metallo-hydrolase [candidate division Zixibacteria bacterium]|nr:MBL fold metallo-hydrolase [candidate division Zixibacteria bacterium]
MNSILKVDFIEVGPFQTNCYLVRGNNKAIIIDPGDEFFRIEKLINKYNAEVEKIILTHGHIDHIGAVSQVKNITNALVMIHPDDAGMLTDAKANLSAYHDTEFTIDAADEFINDGDIIEIGGIQLKTLHTPGHTPGGISLLTDGIVFTGDALFWGSIGRTDLPGANHETLINAIKSKLLTLPDETIVYPGHGPQTTIGKEREINPWLI